MKNRTRLATRNAHSLRQRSAYRTYIAMFSLVTVLSGMIVFFLNLSHPKQAYAVGCTTSYSLDWGDPSTFTVTCGTINSGNWTVKGDTCVYSSPVLNVGGVSGDPSKTIDLSVRINQSGNLTNNDFAWVYAYINGSLAQTYTTRGDTGSAVFSVAVSIVVPAGGNFQISAKVKSDKSNEFWQIKNGEVTACIQNPVSPLPVTLTSFTGSFDNGHAKLKWTTAAEVQNDYFSVLRSSNGTDFAEIARITGSGTTSIRHDYIFSDDQTPIGLSYYQLCQTDYDGKKTEYGPIVIRRNEQNTTESEASVFPNPFTDHFSIVLSSPTNQVVKVSTYGLNGALLGQKEFTAQKGINRLEYESASLLSPGVYLAAIEPESGNRQFLKVIRQ